MSFPKIVAHFETLLVNKIDSNSATMVLESIATPAGNLGVGTYGFVIEEESGSKREYCIGTLSGNTVTFTKRDVSPLDATTADASSDTTRQSHRKGSSVKLTDFPILLLIQRILEGTDQLDPTTPLQYSGTASISSANQLATKRYVDETASGGAITFDNQIYTADAGEDITQGESVYLKDSDGKWYKTKADTPATLDQTLKGIAQGAGTNGDAIAGGVLVQGLDNTTSYTTGQLYYLSDTAGAISATAGTNAYPIGVGDANNKLVLFQGVPTEPTIKQKEFLSATTGMISLFAGSVAPAGFLMCDGQAVSRTTYADLFTVLSTNYGAGDGTTTFNVPDLQGSFPIGVGSRTLHTYTITDASINTTAIGNGVTDNSPNYITIAGHGLVTGDQVITTSSGVPNFTANTVYYAVRYDADHIQIATSYANAKAGTVVAMSNGYAVTLYARTLFTVGSAFNDSVVTGSKVTLSTSNTLPTTIPAGTYYMVRVSSTTFYLADTLAKALLGERVCATTSGSGSSTLKVYDSAITIGAIGGNSSHFITVAEMPSHTHGVPNLQVSSGSQQSFSPSDSSSTSEYSIPTSAAGGNQAISTLSPYVAINYIIKT